MHFLSPSLSPGQPPSARPAMHPAQLVPPGTALELHAAMWDPVTLDLPGVGRRHRAPSSQVCRCCWELCCQGALNTTLG